MYTHKALLHGAVVSTLVVVVLAGCSKAKQAPPAQPPDLRRRQPWWKPTDGRDAASTRWAH